MDHRKRRESMREVDEDSRSKIVMGFTGSGSAVHAEETYLMDY